MGPASLLAVLVVLLVHKLDGGAHGGDRPEVISPVKDD